VQVVLETVMLKNPERGSSPFDSGAFLMVDVNALLATAVEEWAKAQVVFEAPSWQGYPPARSRVERLAELPDCHDGLLALLTDPRQLVVAYALQTLKLMGSPVLAALPDELCDRREQVPFAIGSFRNNMDLGGYARMLRKRARTENWSPTSLLSNPGSSASPGAS
jgi:hypothetical protein